MNERGKTVQRPDGEHYRDIATGLRKLAHQCRFAGARRELSRLEPIIWTVKRDNASDECPAARYAWYI